MVFKKIARYHVTGFIANSAIATKLKLLKSRYNPQTQPWHNFQ